VRSLGIKNRDQKKCIINYQITSFCNAAIAEQNMVGVAAGLARIEFRPVIYWLSAFKLN